jgi:hypothetical protein
MILILNRLIVLAAYILISVSVIEKRKASGYQRPACREKKTALESDPFPV